MNDFSLADNRTFQIGEIEVKQIQVKSLDLFCRHAETVKEYLKDKDAYLATIRTGYLESVALNYAQIFLRCTYVQRKIQDAKYRPQAVDPKIEKQNDLRKVVPPGLYAEYGYMLYQNGKTEEGLVNLKKEIALYPESAPFISRIIKQLEKK